MVFDRWHRALVPVVFSLLLWITGCTSQPSSPYSQVQQETSGRNAPSAVAKTAEQGATFNQFFPGSTGSYTVVPAQEKKGFAEYKLNQDGKTVAMLAITDTSSVPSAAAKYQNSTETIAGYPAIEQGTTATGILVNDRYQVKVLSRDASFTRDDRVDWLQKFDLRGLAQLAPAQSTSAVPRLPKATNRQTPDVPARPVLVPQPAG
ncbi:MAG: hypothetical protein Kow00121_59400 [Elainellaceae cyanobacterium]